MYSNFLYFIIVLLIYTTYQPSENTSVSYIEVSGFFAVLFSLFFLATRLVFKKLEKEINRRSELHHDHKLDNLITRQSIMAVILFAVNIYGLGLPSYFQGLPVFRSAPTLLALCFLTLFIFYLMIIWGEAFRAYRLLHGPGITSKEYIQSNLSFSVPILIPWIFLSGIVDIINLLPFEKPKEILATPAGQAGYFLLFLIALALFAPPVIQRLWGCKPLAQGIYRNRIESFLKKAGVEYAEILNWPLFGGRMITAGVMGIVKQFRYILVTPALLRYLAPEELEAVMAHEIGHVKRYHLLFYLFFFVGFMLLSYAVFDLILYAVIYTEPFYHMLLGSDTKGSEIFTAVFSVFNILVFIIYFRFIFGYFIRNFEREADAYVYNLLDDGTPLISSLEKIAIAGKQSPDKPNWHHFSISERIAFMKKCQADRSWIIRHKNKIRRSLFIYILCIIIIGIIGYNLNFGTAGKTLSKHFFETIITREIEKTPENPVLHLELGDYYYTIAKKYDKAINAYEKSIILKPDNPEALNNLAWLYAQCEDKNFRNPEKALNLAQKAAFLKRAPHILDTLAEAYYVNHRFEEAVLTEMKALEMAGKDRFHYEKQLEKFQKALHLFRQ